MTSTIFANPVTTISQFESKDTLRRAMRARLAAMTLDEISAGSALLVNRLQSDDWLPAGSTVALFGGIRGEPDLLGLIPWLLERQATPVFFGFADGLLIPRRVTDPKTMTRGIFGVWVPAEDAQLVPYEALDVILTPGLAFGYDNRRLGRGRGHFDRLFAQPEIKARRLGVCWGFQRVPTVPVESHDALMDAVVTEK